MGYRDELEAAKRRIEQLEGENEALKKFQAPGRSSRRRLWMLTGMVVVTLVVGIIGVSMYADDELDRAHEESDALRGRIRTLRDTQARLQREIGAMRTEHRELAQSLSATSDARQRLQAASPSAPTSPERPRRLTDARLATRLMHCVPYGSGSGGADNPYGEGVVTRIDAVLVRRSDVQDRVTGLPWPEIFRIVTVQVPGRGEVMLEDRNGLYASLEYRQFYEFLWNHVEVGDIIGVSWHIDAPGTEPRITGMRTTDK